MILWRVVLGTSAVFVKQIEKARAEHRTWGDRPPGVHDGSRADGGMDGSTEFITKTITEAPAGSTWAIGHRDNLVSRLARETRTRRCSAWTR